MRQLAQQAIRTGTKLHRQSLNYLNNARDRLFNAHSMVKAGQTPYDVVYATDLARLRHYRPLEEATIPFGEGTLPVSTARHRIPVVIVPPLAVNMLIYDLFPERSFVRYLLARGFDVYLIDWGKPRRRHTHFTMHTYVAELMPRFLAEVRERSGQDELSLHGWSMGGMFVLFYCALTGDPHIRNAVVLGSPIDSHANGVIGVAYQQMHKLAETIRQRTGFRLHNLRPHWLHTPGWANTLGFKLTTPVASLKGYWELVAKLGDREFVENHATTSAFLDHMVAYPGGVIQDTVVRVWIDNELSRGGIQIGDDRAELRNVRANLLAFAGKSDTLVTPDAADDVMHHVGSADKRFEIVPGGHMGILAGSKAPETAWPITADWLAERSA